MAVRSAALWSVTSQWLVFAFNFAVSVFLARALLPPSAFGTFSVGFAAAGIVSMLQDFGLNRFLVRAELLSDRLLDTCTTITALVGAAVCLVICGLSWPVAWYYDNAQLLPIMLLIGVAFVLLPFNTVPIALLQRSFEFRTLSLINLTAAVANGIVSIGFALAGFGAVSLACGFVAQQLARATIAQRCGGRPLRFRPTLAEAGPVVSFGSGTTVLAISGAIGTRSPDLIIGSALGMQAVGLFGRAAGMVDGLRVLLNGGLSTVFYSHFAHLVRNRRPLDGAYLHLVACYTGVMWPAMFLLSMLAAPVVETVYGPGWADAAEALRWVALSELIFFALPLHTDIPLLTGQLRPLLVRNILDTAVALICLVCLVRFGLAAAAAARLVYATLWFCLYFGLMRRLVGFRPAALFGVHARSGVATLAAALPVLWSYPIRGVLAIEIAAPIAVTGACLWLAALAVLRHPIWHELTRAAQSGRSLIGRRLSV